MRISDWSSDVCSSDLPDWATIEQAASEAGMEARHIPVTPGAIRDDDAARFRAALDGLPGPTVAFCRTGTRSAMLWALSNADERSRDELIATAADAGYDIAQGRDDATPRPLSDRKRTSLNSIY